MMLEVREIDAGYGKKQVLFGFSLDVHDGEIVALIGPNGAGKTTVLKAVCGLIPVWNGKIRLDGNVTNDSTPSQNIGRGVVFAPQGGRAFDGLSVIENLEVGGFLLGRKELSFRIEEVFNLFPVLRQRARQDVATLSGGERQMLTLARALIPKPKLIMLDEPSHGLSPNLVVSVFRKISQINCEMGVSCLVVEQRVGEILQISNRVYSVKLGRVVFEGIPRVLQEDKTKLRQLFL